VRVRLVDGMLVVELGEERRVLSSAVLGGGLGSARAWLAATVPGDYSRTDPALDLAERAAELDLPGPVVGMLTAADVEAHERASSGAATVFATVGLGHPLAACGTRPRRLPGAGTINLLVVVEERLDDAALVGAAQTAVEAKAQALAAGGVRAVNAGGPATGTATDAVCIAARCGGGVAFAGPATRVGGDIARAVFTAVHAGVLGDRAERVAEPPAGPATHAASAFPALRRTPWTPGG
jgi:adenosylcobinamide hydrolase